VSNYKNTEEHKYTFTSLRNQWGCPAIAEPPLPLEGVVEGGEEAHSCLSHSSPFTSTLLLPPWAMRDLVRSA
jgi:hypothetical protein